MEYVGELFALLTAVLWSFSSFIFTTVGQRIGTIQLNIYRLLFASIFLLITFFIFNIKIIADPMQVLYLGLSSIIGLVIGDTFLFKGFDLIGPRHTLLIMSINPAIAAIIAFFALNERMGVFAIIGMLVTLAGIALVILDKKQNENSRFKLNKRGVVFAFIGAAGQGVGIIFAKLAFVHGDIHGLVATFIRLAIAAVILFPATAIIGSFKNPFKIFAGDKKSFGLILLGSIIGPYLGITFSFYAIIYTKIGIASTLMATIPIIMLPLSVLIYKEKLSWKSILGAFISVAGVAILFLH
ncbi:MAG: EamA family transporter [Bacteroidetes bacterium]|nr:MAG: EamA family transporter [Bacteroidota bacterium]